MGLYALIGGGLLLLWLVFGRKGSKKAELSTNEKTHPPQGPRIVGPDDLVVPAALLYQLGREQLEKQLVKMASRGAVGGGQGGTRAEGEDETPSSPPEH